MKTLILSIVSAFILASTQTSLAQVSSYTFSQSVQSYGSPNTGTVIGTLLQDDDVNPATLPFNFVYNGTTYTTINVCSNGYLSFNGLSGSEYQAISDVISSNVIAPFAQDLFMGTVIRGDLSAGSNTVVNVTSSANLSVGDTLVDMLFDFGGNNPVITAIIGNTIILSINSLNTVTNQDMFFKNGSIRQNVTGTAPNRVCEFEYKNMTRFTVYDESINFKVRLYETSNKIEFLYGTTIIGLSNFPSEVGLKGANNSDFNSRTVNATTTWSTSTMATLITDACDFDFNNLPTPGLRYVWSPVSCTNPTLTITASSSSICSGQSATLTATGANTYSWSTGSTSSQISVSPSVSTSYTLFGFDGTCSNSVAILQLVTPQPTLSIAQTKTVICKGQTATLTAMGAVSYTWSNGSNASFIVVSPSVTTNYTLVGANLNCSSHKTITQVVSNCTDINEAKAIIETFNAYPNPFSNQLTIKNPFQEKVNLKVYDVLGTLIEDITVEADASHGMSTENLKEGIYIVVLEHGDKTLSKKVIKH